MTTRSTLAFSAIAALAALVSFGPAVANPATMPQSGRIGTLPLGAYQCTLPGDASGAPWHRIPDNDFTILNASSYEARGQRGVYLLRGQQVTFTRGPLKGKMLERAGRRILREREADGTLGRMRCVRSGPAR